MPPGREKSPKQSCNNTAVKKSKKIKTREKKNEKRMRIVMTGLFPLFSWNGSNSLGVGIAFSLDHIIQRNATSLAGQVMENKLTRARDLFIKYSCKGGAES